ncbi:MAG: DUF945 family protein [Chromatiaceae bacterium]|nr:MAG: DUF945 family protein [Chromatiaceae bacterium]
MSVVELVRSAASLLPRARARWPWPLLTVLLLLVLIALAPELIGRWAEQAYRAALGDLADRGYVAVEQAYQRGWFEASAVTLIAPATAIDPGDPQRLLSPRLRIGSRIEHGPRRLADLWRWPLPLVSVHNRISVIGAPRALPALLADGSLGWGAALDLRLRLPDVTYVGVAGDLQLVDGHSDLHIAAGGRRLRVSGALRLLEASDPTGAALTLIRTAWTLALRRGGGLPVGTLALTMDALSLGAGDRGGVDARSGLDAEAVRLELGLEQSDDQLALQIALDLGRLDLPGLALGRSRLALRLDRLHAPAIRDLIAAERELAARRLPGSLYGFALVGLLTEQVPALLSAGPALSLEELELQTADGPLSVRLDLRLVPVTVPVDLRQVPPLTAYLQPVFWLDRLVGEGHILVPQPLLARWIGAQQRQRVRAELAHQGVALEVLPADLEAEVSDAADAALGALIRNRWLVPREGRLGALLLLGDGLLTINGKTLALAELIAPGDQ